MSAPAITASEVASGTSTRRKSRNRDALRRVGIIIIGALFCLTPLTAIVVLGWLTRFSRRTAMRRLEVLARRRTDQPGPRRPPDAVAGWPRWFVLPGSEPLRSRLLGALWQNTKTGCAALFSLLIATLPFTLIWLLSWWSGWENSFNKGYEQSWVGPALGLTGVFLALNVLAYLPMAVTHQAVENRWRAFFEIARIRALIAQAGWRYIGLSLIVVLLALPILASRGLPVFIENIKPGFEDLSAADQAAVADQIRLMTVFYIFSAAVFIRWLAAHVYAAASIRNGKRWKLTQFIQIILLWLVWFGLVAQIFIAQFLNHNWWLWINHPFILLPWSP